MPQNLPSVVKHPVEENTESATGGEENERPPIEEALATTTGTSQRPPLVLAHRGSSRRLLLESARDLVQGSLQFESSLRAVPEPSSDEIANVQPTIAENSEEHEEGDENYDGHATV